MRVLLAMNSEISNGLAAWIGIWDKGRQAKTTNNNLFIRTSGLRQGQCHKIEKMEQIISRSLQGQATARSSSPHSPEFRGDGELAPRRYCSTGQAGIYPPTLSSCRAGR